MNYTIKQVSEMTGLSIPTIRYYDKEGLLPDLQRKESGYRIFSDRDLEAIDLIGCFKESELTIREIRHFMSLVRQGDVTLSERLAIFRTHIGWRRSWPLCKMRWSTRGAPWRFMRSRRKPDQRRLRKISTSPGMERRTDKLLSDGSSSPSSPAAACG